METVNMVARENPSFLTRLRRKILPHQHCFLPENAPSHFADVINIETCCMLNLRDRLKLLFTGCLRVRTATVTEFAIGRNITSSVCFVDLKAPTE